MTKRDWTAIGLGLLILLAGCSSDSGGDSPRGATGEDDRGLTGGDDGVDPPGGACDAGSRGLCNCGEGEGSGTRTCDDGAWSVCGCDDNFGAFDNPTGDGAGGGSAAVDAGPVRTKLDNCSPGSYVGSYTCPLEMGGVDTGLVLQGAVAFDLAIDESVVQDECEVGQEFCFDLVIAEGSGTLFGFVNFFIGFETLLEGGLDCTTGEFHASAVDGIWGIPVASDPSDPMSPATVSQPPAGMFDGSLDGLHLGGSPQAIEGTWDLVELATQYRCPGPFKVERQP